MAAWSRDGYGVKTGADALSDSHSLVIAARRAVGGHGLDRGVDARRERAALGEDDAEVLDVGAGSGSWN